MIIDEVSLLTIIVLFLAGGLAGFCDSTGGGGGFVSIPILLTLGVPPTVALGTNKFQSSIGLVAASCHYLRHTNIDLRALLPGIIATFIGAAIGTNLVQRIDSDFLITIVPFLLLGVFIYTLFSPDVGRFESKSRLRLMPLGIIFGLLLGAYDGFFGPGTGAFWVLALVVVGGFDLAKATIQTKILNMTSNISALIFFAINDNVIYTIGISMAFGQIFGARLGAGLVLRHGWSFIRPIFLVLVFVTIANLFYNQYGHLV